MSDPTSKYELFDKLMEEYEADHHLEKVEIHIKPLLGKCTSTKAHAVDSLVYRRAAPSTTKIAKLFAVCARRPATTGALTRSNAMALGGWDGYKRDS